MTDGPIRTQLDADGVLLATIDMAGRTMNVFSVELMDALDALMDRVDQDAAVRGCVITSGKPSFVAGADLVMVRGYCDSARTASHAQMFEMCGRLGRQFVRMEAAAKPFVAAVNGLALGGGLELSLACRERLVADDAKLQLGLPEVRWGLLPGAGGTQRLPRLAGFAPAMDMLLTGRSIDPAMALELNIVSAVVPAGELIGRAKERARALHGTALDLRAKFPRLDQADVPAHSEAAAREIAAKHGVSSEDYDLYPAHSAIVDSVLKGARMPLAEATALEMNQFLRLMFSPVAGRMLRTLFLERLRAERELAPPADSALASLRVGPVSELRGAWRAALAKLKLPQESDASLPTDTVEAIDRAGTTHRAALRVLEEQPGADDATQLVLAPQGPYGRVIEIVNAPASAAGTWAFLATQLWSMAWATPGPASRLQSLRGQPLEAQAPLAARWTGGDPAFTDVAACLSGVSPAWSGGPLSWQADKAPQRA
ncbi:enoyl-CoA hydratase/isomerase family protein [Variovorax paradoxus]|nr:enoyl-CoA hydratase-related protein [Variovorax paradoxus]MBT2301922.1 enoyl-CoA hydratase/isomerase family protein [Variovorax paradoxus]